MVPSKPLSASMVVVMLATALDPVVVLAGEELPPAPALPPAAEEDEDDDVDPGAEALEEPEPAGAAEAAEPPGNTEPPPEERAAPETPEPEPALPDVIDADPEAAELNQMHDLEKRLERLELLYPPAIPVEDHQQLDARQRRLPVGVHVHGSLGTERLRELVEELRRDAERAALAELVKPALPVPAPFKMGPLGPVTSDIPIVDNAMVQHWIRFFTGVGAKYYRKWIARYWRYGPVMRKILEAEGLPSDLVYLSMIESGFSPKAYSFAHAAGQWQFIRATGERMGLTTNFWVDERRDPIKATYAAAKYLRSLNTEFSDWHLAWASYNAGPAKVRRAMRRHNSREFFTLARGRYLRWETRNYVPKLIAAAIIAKDPVKYGFTDVEPLPLFEFHTLPVPDSTSLSSLAKACATDVDTLLELNPELRRPMTPPIAEGAEPYLLRVPVGKVPRCEEGLRELREEERYTYRRHRVSNGETLTALAQRYLTEERLIIAENNLPNEKLQAGEDLILPVPAGRRAPLGHMDDDVTERRGRVVLAKPPRGTKAVRVVVQKGDTLWDIASRFGVDVRSVVAWNGLNRRRRLRVGQRLTVYVKDTSKKTAGAR
ncbi:MAG: LysM peptidoglycan-binding domain-containing protein [Myxococcota bacterium]